MKNDLLKQAVIDFIAQQQQLLSLWRLSNPGSVDTDYLTDFQKSQIIQSQELGTWKTRLHGTGVSFDRVSDGLRVDVPYGVEFADAVEPNRIFDYITTASKARNMILGNEDVTRERVYQYFDQCQQDGCAKIFITRMGKQLYKFEHA